MTLPEGTDFRKLPEVRILAADLPDPDFVIRVIRLSPYEASDPPSWEVILSPHDHDWTATQRRTIDAFFPARYTIENESLEQAIAHAQNIARHYRPRFRAALAAVDDLAQPFNPTPATPDQPPAPPPQTPPTNQPNPPTTTQPADTPPTDAPTKL